MLSKEFQKIFLIISLLFACGGSEEQEYYYDVEESYIEAIDVTNDCIHFGWFIPQKTRKLLSSFKLMAISMKGAFSVNSLTAIVYPNITSYKFENLVGNMTYRISVEGFSNERSLIYTSALISTSLAALNWLPAPSDIALIDKSAEFLEIRWTTPVVASAGTQAMVNQHLINLHEFNHLTKTSTHRYKLSIQLPTTRATFLNLEPRTIYNITIQASTEFGYGNIGWAVYSTLDFNEEFILRLKSRTPNSLTIKWPTAWFETPSTQYTIKAKTLHSIDGSEKEILISSSSDGRNPEHILHDLDSGATFNVTLICNAAPITAIKMDKKIGGKSTRMNKKIAWAVFSTLQQGEFVVDEPRVALETDAAASLVWHKIHHHQIIIYQVRYSVNHEEKPYVLEPHSETSLACPKVGCDWLCFLVFNLPQHPRYFSFDVRAKVAGIWNKWVPIARRPWNLMERVCSINPPPSFVENIGREEFMREIVIESSDITDFNAWMYLVVVDKRLDADLIGVFDISRLNDKAISDHEQVPYYITAALTLEHIQQKLPFRIGDGKVHGGYLNYPLSKDLDPRWFIIPLSYTENEIMEPSLKFCGFREDGIIECNFSIAHILNFIPWWIGLLVSIIIFIILLCLCLGVCKFLRRQFCLKMEKSEEKSDTSVAPLNNSIARNRRVKVEFEDDDSVEFNSLLSQ